MLTDAAPFTGSVGFDARYRERCWVPNAPRIPVQLSGRPFILAEARAAGVSPDSLRSKAWRRLGSGLYCSARAVPDPWQVLHAWMRRLGSNIVFAGATSAWMHGLDFQPTDPVEVIVPGDSTLRSRAGVTARRCGLTTDDRAVVKNLPTTSLTRTLLDFCITRTPVEALVAIDMSIQRRLIETIRLTQFAESLGGRNGAGRLRFLSAFGEPAESPMETRLRWLLLTSGLPRPLVQIELRDPRDRFLARADLLYEAARLVIEFDGANHRDRLTSDDRRQNLLVTAGYRVLRFTTADIKNRADDVIAQVRFALGVTPPSHLAPNRAIRAR